MNVGDLVKLKWRGNGHHSVGLIVETEDGEYRVLWDSTTWSMSLWRERELEVFDEGG